MNDHRFIELLNLYIDHQIDPAEAAELEAAVHSTPDRRRTYEEYCRLQRACSQLGSNARAAAPVAPRFTRSLEEAERKINTPPRTNRWYPLQVGALASLAMAAGFVLVVQPQLPWSTSANPVSPANQLTSKQTAPLVVTSGISPPAAVSLAAFNVHPAHVASGLVSAPNTDEIYLAAPDQEALAWMQRVEQLPATRLVLDDRAFTSRGLVPLDTRAFRHPRTLQIPAELTGFPLPR